MSVIPSLKLLFLSFTWCWGWLVMEQIKERKKEKNGTLKSCQPNAPVTNKQTNKQTLSFLKTNSKSHLKCDDILCTTELNNS
jgi:hypothetical protein